MPQIVLTADRALFTDFSGADPLGFGLCMPVRLVPKIVEYRILAPPAKADSNGRALYAPYALAKVEAALNAAGFSRDEVVVTPPEKLYKVVDKDTRIIGVHVVDPQGLAPVSWTLKAMCGGGITCTQYEFEKLMKTIKRLRDRGFKFKLVVGGPGAWQLRGREDKFGIDVLYEGEAEVTFPLIVRKILNGEEVPRRVMGSIAPVEKIPAILTPSRNGLVEITRGCPRRCHFCSPTMRAFRSIPLETIVKELSLNFRHGARSASFITEDIFMYGASLGPLRFNEDAVVKLYETTLTIARRYGVDRISFSHATISSALACPKLVKYISEANSLDADRPFMPQIGLESGSPRIVRKYFAGKPWPWKPEEWPEVVVEGSKLINDYYWYPCYTYIIGFPDATPEDYIKTIELLDRLRDEGFKGWTFPLLLIPMGGTLIEKKASFQTLRSLPREAIEAMVEGWRISIKFSEWAYPRIINGIKNPIIRRIALKLKDLLISSMKSWVDELSRRGVEVLEEFSKVDIRSFRGVLRTVVEVVKTRV